MDNALIQNQVDRRPVGIELPIDPQDGGRHRREADDRAVLERIFGRAVSPLYDVDLGNIRVMAEQGDALLSHRDQIVSCRSVPHKYVTERIHDLPGRDDSLSRGL